MQLRARWFLVVASLLLVAIDGPVRVAQSNSAVANLSQTRMPATQAGESIRANHRNQSVTTPTRRARPTTRPEQRLPRLRSAPGRQLPDPESLGAVYRPPRRGAPRIRVNAGARGGGERPVVYALAPTELGLTKKEMPVLYGYLPGTVDRPVEFALVIEDEPIPELEIVWERLQSGWLRIDLAEWDVELRTDVPYRWSIAIVLDSNSRSKDVVAAGMIQREPLASRDLNSADRQRQGRRDGIRSHWYDDVHAAITDWIQVPSSKQVRQQLEQLLVEAELADLCRMF